MNQNPTILDQIPEVLGKIHVLMDKAWADEDWTAYYAIKLAWDNLNDFYHLRSPEKE